MTTRRLCAGIALLLLTACASNNHDSDAPIPPRPTRADIVNFDMHARAAIRTSKRGETLSIRWQHTASTDVLAFISPLGNIVAELASDRSGARWLSADGDRYEAQSADMLMARLTEVPVPLEALALWVTGRTTAKAQSIQRDPLGRLVAANDSGWVIQISAYENDVPNALPRILEASREGLRIRLVIEAWQV